MAKELIFPKKSTFVLEDYSEDDLKPDEISGSTVCSIISQGTELAWANGEDFPIRPGYGAVFRVEKVGSKVKNIQIGELRFCMGAHRSTQKHAEKFTLPLPAKLPPQLAVLTRLMGVSMTTLMTTQARPGDQVMIFGAGPVGFLAYFLFSIGGYEVSVVEPDKLRQDQLKSVGITSVFKSVPLEDSKFAKRVALVLDCSGHEKAIIDACQMVKQNGEVVLVGVPWKQWTDISAHQILKEVFFNFVQIRSGWEWQLPILSRGFVWEELLKGYNNASHDIFSGFERALKWLATGRVKVDSLIQVESPSNPSLLYQKIAKKDIQAPFIILDWEKFNQSY